MKMFPDGSRVNLLQTSTDQLSVMSHRARLPLSQVSGHAPLETAFQTEPHCQQEGANTRLTHCFPPAAAVADGQPVEGAGGQQAQSRNHQHHLEDIQL